MAKEETYRGKTLEELQKMSLEEFAQLVESRARRALLRAYRNNPEYMKLIKKVRKWKEQGKTDKKMIKTRLRSAVIIPEWVGLTFGVHNGKEYKPVKITISMLGRRLGEFSHTTAPVKHSGPGVGATRGSKFVPLK